MRRKRARFVELWAYAPPGFSLSMSRSGPCWQERLDLSNGRCLPAPRAIMHRKRARIVELRPYALPVFSHSTSRSDPRWQERLDLSKGRCLRAPSNHAPETGASCRCSGHMLRQSFRVPRAAPARVGRSGSACHKGSCCPTPRVIMRRKRAQPTDAASICSAGHSAQHEPLHPSRRQKPPPCIALRGKRQIWQGLARRADRNARKNDNFRANRPRVKGF